MCDECGGDHRGGREGVPLVALNRGVDRDDVFTGQVSQPGPDAHPQDGAQGVERQELAQCMPMMPDRMPLSWRSTGMNRAMVTSLPPWRLK